MRSRRAALALGTLTGLSERGTACHGTGVALQAADPRHLGNARPKGPDRVPPGHAGALAGPTTRAPASRSRGFVMTKFFEIESDATD
jgi:hypothetical protein